mmetsp:Transcript_17080/g.39483  ORF Transcript_17080/g.39483 Transcript_17080/m.39483 type:complete len:212 (-) Transcript_17080:222-857(-)
MLAHGSIRFTSSIGLLRSPLLIKNEWSAIRSSGFSLRKQSTPPSRNIGSTTSASSADSSISVIFMDSFGNILLSDASCVINNSLNFLRGKSSFRKSRSMSDSATRKKPATSHISRLRSFPQRVVQICFLVLIMVDVSVGNAAGNVRRTLIFRANNMANANPGFDFLFLLFGVPFSASLLSSGSFLIPFHRPISWPTPKASKIQERKTELGI